MEVELTPLICAQIRKGLRLSVQTLADVLAVDPKTIEAWERRRGRYGLAGDFLRALAVSMRVVGPDAAWGPSWLSRRQRLVWILRTAASAGADSCMGGVLVPPLSLEALQPNGRIRYRPPPEPARVDRESPPATLCLRVRRTLGLQLKELAELLSVTDNQICNWEHGHHAVLGLEIDLYEVLDTSLRQHGRSLTWGPRYFSRGRRLLHIFQLGSTAKTCIAPLVNVSGPPAAGLELPEVFLRVSPERANTARRTA